MRARYLAFAILASCSDAKHPPSISSDMISGHLEGSAQIARETFERIEQRILLSKTLRVKFDWGGEGRHLPDPECGARRGGSWGKILIKGDNRVLYEEWGCSGANEVRSTRVSNGERLHQIAIVHEPGGITSKSRGVEEKDCSTPADRMGENLRVAFARSGRSGVNWFLWMLLESPEKHPSCPNMREAFQVSEFEKGFDQKGGHFVRYRMSTTNPTAHNTHRSVVKLWYEEKTYRPIKRFECPESDYGKKDAIIRIDEYDEFVINEEMPDALFALMPAIENRR